MKKKAMFIFMLFLTVCIMYVFSETGVSEKTTTGQPPLLENNTGYLPESTYPAAVPGAGAAAVVQQGVSAPVPPAQPQMPAVPVPPASGGPVPSASGRTNGPAFPVPSFSRVRSIDIASDKIQQVLSTSKSTRKYLKPGKIWILREPGGELEIKGGIMYRGVVISAVAFSPVTGLALPSGYMPAVYQEDASMETIRSTFEKIVNTMKILEGVWYSQPEGDWIVPIAYNGKIITFLKVYTDGVHIIPDYEASREMAYYGQ